VIDEEEAIIQRNDYEREAYRESLLMLHQQTQSAIVSHIISSGFVVYALQTVVKMELLLSWWTALVVVGITRALLSHLFLSKWPIPDNILTRWTVVLTGLTFMQTLCWGLSVFIIWPEPVEYRAFIVAVLAGVIAAGGIMLAVHRYSFIIFCLPVVIPAVYQLVSSGTHLELMLAILLVIYSIILIVAVSRLGNSFLEGIKVRFRMQALSRTDPLTRLANRRGFDEYLADAWQTAIRSKQPVGLIVSDVDYFKAYNDQYGHPQGDEALKRVADTIYEVASRGTDLCARVGGEEFAIVLQLTDEEGARRVAQDIKQAMDELHMDHGGSPFRYLTLSLGYASIIPDRDSSPDQFFERVDKMLYRAKTAGRNRIEPNSDFNYQ